MWALGTLVHELLTSEVPFLEADTQDISSCLQIDTTLYTTDIPPATDMTLLYNYCHGVNDFPTERLLKHRTSEKGVEFLKNLLAVNPNARPTATEALESLWLIERDKPIEEAVNLDLDPRVTGADTLVDPKLIERRRTNEEATSLNPGTHAIPLPIERDSVKKETVSSDDSTQVRVLDQFFQSLINKKHGVPTTHAVRALPPAERGRDIKCGIDCESMRTEFLSLGVQLSPETASRLIIEDKAGTAKLLRSSTRLGIRTIQHSAASNRYLEAMKILLKVTDDIDFRIEGFTPLQSAVNGDHLDMVDLLLRSGADVNAIARSSFELIRTALQVGAKRGNLDMVKLLLDNGAEVDAAPARYGRTALQAAAEEGHLEVVKLLYNNGADINASPAKEGNARTALQAAAARNCFATVKFLLYNDADVNAGPANGYPTALQLAARYSRRNCDVVCLLLDSGADPNINSPNIGTPLQAAAEIGNLDLVELLLERGANINAEPATNRGRTALQAAAGGAHFDLVKLFLERGADINSEPAINGGRTALQAAAERGNLELVELLLENGADVNAGPAIEEGKTALQAATEGKHLDIASLLLRKGARNSN